MCKISASLTKITTGFITLTQYTPIKSAASLSVNCTVCVKDANRRPREYLYCNRHYESFVCCRVIFCCASRTLATSSAWSWGKDSNDLEILCCEFRIKFTWYLLKVLPHTFYSTPTCGHMSYFAHGLWLSLRSGSCFIVTLSVWSVQTHVSGPCSELLFCSVYHWYSECFGTTSVYAMTRLLDGASLLFISHLFPILDADFSTEYFLNSSVTRALAWCRGDEACYCCWWTWTATWRIVCLRKHCAFLSCKLDWMKSFCVYFQVE